MKPLTKKQKHLIAFCLGYALWAFFLFAALFAILSDTTHVSVGGLLMAIAVGLLFLALPVIAWLTNP